MSVKVWDVRAKQFVSSYEINYQVTSVAFSANNDYIFFGGLDNSIKALNLKKNAIDYSLLGHTDTVTGITLSHNGNFLLSNAMDNSLKVWDIRPFAPESRCMKTFQGI